MKNTKITKKKVKSELHAVFNIKTFNNSNNAVIKCVGHIKKDEKFIDERIKCSDKTKNQYVYELSEDITVRFNKCHMIDTYLVSNQILPILYASVTYENSIVKSVLFNIFINFKIDDIKKIISEKQLINKKISGKYSVSIKLDDKTCSDTTIDKYISDEEMVKTIKEMLKTDEMTKLIYQMKEKRRQERQEIYGSIDDFQKPPTIKYNFKNLVSKYKKTGKIDIQ